MILLYKTIVGSRLYGIDNADSDTDIKGFGLPEPDQLLGLNHWEQTREVNEEAKTDSTIFALAKYIKYTLGGNPTILETAFVDPKFVLHTTPLGEEVCKFVRDNFIVKKIFKSYSAYFLAQLHKLQRPNREGKRQPLIDKYGYDTKFASHTYRLGIQCIGAMYTGVITPTLTTKHAKRCKAIRNGEYSLDEFLSICNVIDLEMKKSYDESTLKAEVDFKKANEFLCEIQTKYIKGEYEF